MKSGVLVAVMAAVTILLRFLPFWVFKGKTPAYITYLGKVLPPAIIGMLVIYCLRNTSIQAAPMACRSLLPQSSSSVCKPGNEMRWSAFYRERWHTC